jgi:hypothetical protein
MTLLYPFPSNYSIVNNLNPNLTDILECPSMNIIIGIYKKDFNDLAEVYGKITNVRITKLITF